MVERTIDVKVRPRLDAVTVRPGDKLVVRVNGNMSRAEVDEWKAYVAELLPGVELVVVTGVEQLLVYRPAGGVDE